MIYYSENGVVVRDLVEKDIEILTESERAQGWHWATTEKTGHRLPQREAGECVILTAEVDGEPAGYVTLYWNARGGAFKDMHIPLVEDFNVLIKFRRRGIGNKMMDVLEQLAAEKCDKICLGVGLYTDYGAAQRIYVKRGYVPDGSGVWYEDVNLEPGADCCNDDDLMLFLSKDLRK